METPFEIGAVVSNEEMRVAFKIGNMGGMRKSNTLNCLVLISDHTKRCLLIIPVTSSDRDGVRWVKNAKGTIEPRKMECKQFTMPLFETWGWDKNCVYRATGQLVTAEKKVMLLFNFNDAESWRAKEQRA